MYINFWYVAAKSDEVTDESPVKVRMLGHEFALWRDTEGQVHCISNTCTHRAGALGDGRINAGCIECPYHGWTFNGDGECVRIPSLGKDAKIPDRARVDAYPAEEKYGLVHVFLGDLPASERPPIIELPEAEGDEWYPQIFTVDWEVDYRRAIENTLDPAHNEFVHDTHGFQGRNDDYKVAEFDLEESTWGAGFMVPMYAPALPEEDMHKASGRQGDEWAEAGAGNHGPNVTWTYIHISPEAKFHNISFHTPVDYNRDPIYIIMYRNFMHDAKHDDDFVKRFWYVADQDRVVLEGMSPLMTPDHHRNELFVPSDKCIDRYRKFCREWDQRGWKIDFRKVQADEETLTYAIPSPARSIKHKGWVLPSVPLISDS